MKHRLCALWLLQVAERCTENGELRWQTVLEVCNTLRDQSTFTQAELSAAAEAASGVMSLVRSASLSTWNESSCLHG